LFAPKGTPKEVIDKITAAAAKVLANPDVAQRFAAVETDPLKVSMTAFNDLLRKESETWSPLVRQLDLKQE
jgi:tripartite-type tricarboxylate transporter receptor subunit TctC